MKYFTPWDERDNRTAGSASNCVWWKGDESNYCQRASVRASRNRTYPLFALPQSKMICRSEERRVGKENLLLKRGQRLKKIVGNHLTWETRSLHGAFLGRFR